MAIRPPYYFAFVRRGPDRRYRACVHDLRDCEAVADSIPALVDALRHCAAARFDPHSLGWPLPTDAAQLPPRPDAHEGYWMQVEPGDAVPGRLRGPAGRRG